MRCKHCGGSVADSKKEIRKHLLKQHPAIYAAIAAEYNTAVLETLAEFGHANPEVQAAKAA